MLIVSRWLRERRADEGRLIFLEGPFLPLQALLAHCATAGPNSRPAGAAAEADAERLAPDQDPVIQPRWPE